MIASVSFGQTKLTYIVEQGKKHRVEAATSRDMISCKDQALKTGGSGYGVHIKIACLESVHIPLEPMCYGRPRVHVALPESLVLLLVYCCPFCVL